MCDASSAGAPTYVQLVGIVYIYGMKESDGFTSAGRLIGEALDH